MEAKEVKRIQRAFLEAAPWDSPRPDCPDPEDLWAGVQGELSPSLLSPLLRHLASCPVCTESWRLAQQISQDSEEAQSPQDLRELKPKASSGPASPSALEHPAAAPSRGAGTASPHWTRWAGIAAVLIVTIGLAYLWTPNTQGPGSGFRAAPEAALALQTTRCTPQDCLLQWQNLAGAEYDVRMTTPAPQFETLYEMKGVQQARLQIPPEFLQGIAPGTALQVRIAALGADGERIAAETFTLMLQ